MFDNDDVCAKWRVEANEIYLNRDVKLVLEMKGRGG